jgi:flavin-binding protein dodecin
VVRVAEAVGSSTKSWDAAVLDAVVAAKDDAPRPIAVEVIRLWADLGSKRIARYRAHVKIAYRQSIVPAATPRARARSVSRRSRSA